MAEDKEGIVFISNFFKNLPNGYLVDVGAHDGIGEGSMSRELIGKGWKGLLIEPLPSAFDKLKKAYETNPRVSCFRGACSDMEGKSLLYPCEGVSTLDPGWKKACEDWWSHVKYNPPIWVDTYRLDGLLKKFSAPKRIDYLQIDTEGHDLKVLMGMDWNRKPALICVETLDMLNTGRKGNRGEWLPRPELNQYLDSVGYKLQRLTTGGNGIYLRKDYP